MEQIAQKTLPTTDGVEVEVTLYRLGEGVLATKESKSPNTVSSFDTKHFGITKRNVTIEQNVKRACKEFKFTKEETKNILEMLK